MLEKVEAALNWTTWADDLQCRMSGHTQTAKMKKTNEEAAHVWRFVRREDVAFHAIGDIESVFDDVPGHPQDVILLVKAHLSSTTYSQAPLVFAAANLLLAASPRRP